MELAFALAEEALRHGEVPVGCVLVVDGQVIASGRNRANESRNGCRHAEMVVFDQAVRWCKANGRWPDMRLTSGRLYVTSEPCMMCAAAVATMKVGTLVYACRNERFGGFGSVVDVQRLFGYAYPLDIVRDVQPHRAVALLQRFYEMENPNAPQPRPKKKRQTAVSCIMQEENAPLEPVPEKAVLRCNSEIHDEHHETMLPPSPLITRRERHNSLSERAAAGPIHHGRVKYFCRDRGHGFITPNEHGAPDVFVHISDVEGDYVPHEGDEVLFKLCPIPPKFEKNQAVHVILKNLASGVLHERWDQPIQPHRHSVDMS